MPLTGDVAKLGRIRHMLQELARVPSRLAPGLAARLTRRIRGMFASQSDPYGKRWAPNAPRTVAKKGHGRVGYEKGNLEAGSYAAPLPGSGVKIVVGPKGEYMQEPRAGVPRRRVLPDQGMPATWRADIKATLDEEIDKVKP